MKHGIYLIFILFLAFILRYYNLGFNPPAAYGDEISFAWNAWNILKTGTDEYGNSFPLLFRAFDDYKAPIPTYLLVPFLAVGGLDTFVVRLPVVLFAVATIYLVFLLAEKLFDKKVALVSAFLLAISPWHLHLSRGFFESTIALFFLVAATYFFVLAKGKRKYLYVSATFFVLTIYTYLTPRIMLLFFIPLLFLWGKKWILSQKKYALGFFLIIFIFSLPLVKASIFYQGSARIQKLSQARNEQIQREVILVRNSSQSPEIVKRILHNRPLYWLRAVVNDYVEHFSPQFLFLYGDSSLRYGLGSMGLMYLIEMPFLIVGLYVLYTRNKHIFYLFIGWLLIAPIPSALVGKPFAVRSLAIVPPLMIITGVGLLAAIVQVKRLALVRRAVYIVLILGFTGSLGYYLVRYHSEYPSYAATWWGWENKAVIDLAIKEQDKYDYIFLSNFYSGLDLAFAYYTNQDPLVYRNARSNQVILADNRQFIQLGKFYIGSLDVDKKRLVSDIIPPRSLYIGRPEEADSSENITAPNDGRILFKIHRSE